MFAIFKVLEAIVKFYVEEKYDNGTRYAYWIDSDVKIDLVKENNVVIKTTARDKNDSTENKIRIILHNKLNIKDKSIHDEITKLTKVRNDTIHPKRKKASKVIGDEEILVWLIMLENILSKLK